MPNRMQHKHGLFEIVMMGGVVAVGIGYLVSESAFTMTALAVSLLAVVALFRDSFL